MVEVTNPDKLMFPAAELTKADLVEHYQRVAAVMLPHISDRPLTLHRFPNGVEKPGFMQKNASEYFPPFIERVTVAKRDGTVTHPVVSDAEGLAYLANQATITFHAWTTKTGDLLKPDRMILDLDPPTDDFAAARFAARAAKEFLSELGLDSLLMATGSNGYHVVIPAAPSVEIWRIDRASRGLAELLAWRHPDRLTVEFRKAERRGRVFVDWLRNRYSATSVVPWSLRPAGHAPVAVPITWEELDEFDPDHWTLPTVAERLEGSETWRDAWDHPTDLEPLVEAIEGLLSEAGIELEPFDRFRS